MCDVLLTKEINYSHTSSPPKRRGECCPASVASASVLARMEGGAPAKKSSKTENDAEALRSIAGTWFVRTVADDPTGVSYHHVFQASRSSPRAPPSRSHSLVAPLPQPAVVALMHSRALKPRRSFIS